MKLLYAPWRSAYTITDKAQTDCVFCTQLVSTRDTEHFILQRFKHCAVMLNIYPYNAGHLLVIPYSHSATLEQLSPDERSNIMHAATVSTSILRTALSCDGINIGLNMGKASGGSIPQHLHLHAVPRWFGDTNFLVTTVDTKPLSVDLVTLYHTLKNAFLAIPPEQFENTI